MRWPQQTVCIGRLNRDAGGIYIAGGITPRLLPRLSASATGGGMLLEGILGRNLRPKFRDFLATLPVSVITNDKVQSCDVAVGRSMRTVTLVWRCTPTHVGPLPPLRRGCRSGRLARGPWPPSSSSAAEGGAPHERQVGRGALRGWGGTGLTWVANSWSVGQGRAAVLGRSPTAHMPCRCGELCAGRVGEGAFAFVSFPGALRGGETCAGVRAS